MHKKDIPLYLILIVIAAAGVTFVRNEIEKIATLQASETQAAAVASRATTPTSEYQKIVSSENETTILANIAAKDHGRAGMTQKSLQGSLYVIYVEKSDAKAAEQDPEIIFLSGRKAYSLLNASNIPINPNLSGAKIELTGLASESENTFLVNLDAKDLKAIRAPRKSPRSWTRDARSAPCGGNFCALVIPLNTTGDVSSLPLPSDIRDYIFNGRIHNLFTEQSYGHMNYGGVVTDWIEVNGSQNIWAAPTEVAQYLATNNINVADYDQVVFLINGGPNGAGGLASIGSIFLEVGQNYYEKPVAMIGFSTYQNNGNLTMANGNLSYFDHLYSHETGHNLNALHDNLLHCMKNPIALPSECVPIEYGNNYSGMGGGTLGNHFSFWNKLRVGWINMADLIQTSSGSYAVTPIELPDPVYVGFDYMNDNFPEYVFEKRSSAGFDTVGLFTQANLDGAFVYRNVPEYGWTSPTSDPMLWNFLLVDTTPGKKSSDWVNPLYDAVLKIPQNFQDGQRGRGFKQNAGGANSMIDVYPLTSASAPCGWKPIKVFEPKGTTDTFPGQVGTHKWPVTVLPPVNIQTLSGDVNDPSAQVLVYKSIMTFNDDNIACGPGNYTFKLKFGGQDLPLMSDTTATYPAFSGPHYHTLYAFAPIHGLTYGPQTVTLEVTKLNDGTIFTKDMVFELVP